MKKHLEFYPATPEITQALVVSEEGELLKIIHLSGGRGLTLNA
jgi:hypothetical protein